LNAVWDRSNLHIPDRSATTIASFSPSLSAQAAEIGVSWAAVEHNVLCVHPSFRSLLVFEVLIFPRYLVA